MNDVERTAFVDIINILVKIVYYATGLQEQNSTLCNRLLQVSGVTYDSDTNISNFFSRKHSFLSEEAKLIKSIETYSVS